MTLAERVKTCIAITESGTVYGAAREWGVPMQVLYRIVWGTTPSPRAKTLAKIAAACDTTVEWLLSGEGKAPPSRAQVEFDRALGRAMASGLVTVTKDGALLYPPASTRP